MMDDSYFSITIYEPDPRSRCCSLGEASEKTGMHPEMILEFVRAGFVRGSGTSRPGLLRFTSDDIERLHRIEDLRQDGRVGLHIVCYVLRLLDRLAEAEREVKELRLRVTHDWPVL